MQPLFYLASTSPRRYELLSLLDIPFSVLSINIPEIKGEKESPVDYVIRLSKEKSQASSNPSLLPIPIIGADTIGVVDDTVLEKPKDERDAKRMLKMLSGKTHTVYTGVTINYQNSLISKSFETYVTFRHLSDAEIDSYLSSGDYRDKAGAYGIQGRAGAFVTHINGSYHSVMGLPTAQVREMLGQLIELP